MTMVGDRDQVQRLQADSASTINARSLPKLLYVSNAAVENSTASSALLYRMFQQYPSDKLRIVEVGMASRPNLRLRGVDYHYVPLRGQRLLYTRFNRLASSIIGFVDQPREVILEEISIGFKPEAVMTLISGLPWRTAARFAKKRQLPLHLLVHDDPVWTNSQSYEWGQRYAVRTLGSVYREATTRHCVSPRMAEMFETEYGISAEVLYPCRAPDALWFSTPSRRVVQTVSPFTVGFAGTLLLPGQIKALAIFAAALAKLGGRLFLYGKFRSELLDEIGPISEIVTIRGFIPPNELVELLRSELDALVHFSSFDKSDRRAMEMGFPSKLAEYSAVGLPIIVFGHDASAGVRWARQYQTAAPIECPSEMVVHEALDRLIGDAQLREGLAVRALAAARTQFSSTTAGNCLMRSLLMQA